MSHVGLEKEEATLQFLLKKIIGVGLLAVGLVILATGMTYAYVGLTVLGSAILLVGAGLLALKIVLRNRSAPNA
ncbi:hypothetical protein HAP47_0017040 [Bradyrhizobium sp. 41S5]|uniref:hypothetical protein n=1 Tax=Bradyrhizobium sp. 41S5 TaxID=1404443 RepID=UPI00156AD601|nr:hypothetical protein [Bradyrhizobium sp. 41S5]UFX48265.1 hypothetical protein HAP47_0017040 [Bradyrhizobium sp. 41S5]